MHYRITLHRPWRPDRRLIHPGRYRVPEDMSAEMAERALAEAGATKETPSPRKDGAAENKLRGRPPMNKSERKST